MQNSKLIQLLFKLKKEELKSFHHFLSSPYHNTNKQTISLFECVKFYHPEVYSPKSKKRSEPNKIHAGLKKERVFRKMHGKKAVYHEGRLNLIMTQLVQLLLDFLVFEEVKKDNYHLEKVKLEVYKNRKMSQAFFKEAEKINTCIKKKENSTEKYLETYLLNKAITNHPEFNVHQSGTKKLELMLQNLDSFFVWEKLRLSVKVCNRERVINEHFEINLLPEVLSTFKSEIDASPLLLFHKRLLSYYKSEDINTLITLVNEFIYMPHIMPFSESQDNLIALLNIIANKCRNGDTRLKRTLFDLYKIGLGFGLFFIGEYISDVIFINAVSVSGKCKDLNWAGNFIKNYKNHLNPLCKDDILLLSKAYLAYYTFVNDKNKNKKHLAVIIKHLRNISFKRPFMAYRTKALLYRVYYEYSLKAQEDLGFIIYFSNAFETQIKRDKSLTSDKKSIFLNFIQLTRQVVKLKLDKNRRHNALKELRENISNKKYLFAKDWLIEKIGELESSP